MQKLYEKMGEERVLFALQFEEVGHLTKESHSPLLITCNLKDFAS